MENRHGLLVDFQVSQASGTAERDAVPDLVDQARERGFKPRTLGADKGYDTKDSVAHLRERKVTPHVAQNTSGRHSAIDGRTTRRVGFGISQRKRKLVEGDLRLDEDDRRVPTDALHRAGADTTRRLFRGCRLQPGPHREIGACRTGQLRRISGTNLQPSRLESGQSSG